MRSIFCLLLGAGLVAGCHSATRSPSPEPIPQRAKKNAKILVTPETILSGKIVLVKNVQRFVIVNFPVGSLPALGQTLDVYRQGMKVAELKVTHPQQDDNTAADILSGETRLGDEVRTR